MAKFERRSIRIAGKVINSPRFSGKNAKLRANEWYARKSQEKDFIERGLMSSDAPTFMQYASQWMRKRMERNPQSTWYSDEYRLRLYLLPALSEFPMNRITRTQMRDVLIRMQEEHGLAINTRTRIKALASKIFTDAMNENPPLIAINPCSNLKFSDARQGKKRPPTLHDVDEIMAFLRCAQSVGKVPAMACALAVLAGLRKSEIIALKYQNVKPNFIRVDHHCEQASLTIKAGTKAGEHEVREVRIPVVLSDLIKAYRKEAAFSADSDFILTDEKGQWIKPRALHDMIDDVVRAFGKPITLHKLRHTFGRMFIQLGGNARVLQDMMGHKSSHTTNLYSEMAGHMLDSFGQVMHIFEAQDLETKSLLVTPIRHQKKDTNE